MIKSFLFIILTISISCTRFKCMDQLPVSPTGKCQVMDINGIYYVQKCKTGKICKEGTDFESGQHYGVCIDFVLPNFVGDACTANEDCMSQNCGGTKCDEPKDACINDLQCDYGKYCDIHKPTENSFKCLDMIQEGNECHDDNECGKFKKCSFPSGSSVGTCQKIGSIKKGYYASDPYLCEFGYLYNDVCSEIKKVGLCERVEDICSNPSNSNFEICLNYDNINNINSNTYKLYALATIDNGSEFNDYVDCRYGSILDEVNYPYYSVNKCKAFQDYLSILNKKYNDYDDDDKMWNFNDIRLYGNNKDIKKKLYVYQHPAVYDYYDKDNDDVDCVVDYLRQKDLNSSWLKINSFLIFLCLFI